MSTGFKREEKILVLKRYGLEEFSDWEDSGINMLYRQIVNVVPSWIDWLIK